MTRFLVGAVSMSSASLNTLNSLADFVRSTITVRSTDFLAHVLDAQLVGQAVGVGAADGLAEFRVALESNLFTHE